jgi:LPS export ABC transporter protein LptC
MAEPGSQQQAPRGIRISRRWITMLLVIGAAGVAVLVMDRRSGPADVYGLATHLDEEADFFMEMAEIEQYRADGSLEYLMLADGVHHFEREALTQLTQPQFTLHRERRSPWHASARNGVLRRPPAGGSEEVLTLSDEVVLDAALDAEPAGLSAPPIRRNRPRCYDRQSHGSDHSIGSGR